MLKIGEFSKLTNISVRMLHHYDEIGLFKPSIVKENQYRYYSHHQYDTFTIITILKSIGMSLNDIKIYLETRTPQLLIDLLKCTLLKGHKYMNALPKDPVMLLSFVNMQLRDNYSSLDEFCKSFMVDKNAINDKLGMINYIYDENSNQFK